MAPAAGATSRSLQSTALRSQRRSWRANFSATKKIVSGYDLLKSGKVSLTILLPWLSEIEKLSWEEQRELEVNIKYEGYIKRQLAEVAEFSHYENKLIPLTINYSQIANLAQEAREKLTRIGPNSLGQARRIAGINPTDIQVLNYHLKKYFFTEKNSPN